MFQFFPLKQIRIEESRHHRLTYQCYLLKTLLVGNIFRAQFVTAVINERKAVEHIVAYPRSLRIASATFPYRAAASAAARG